MSTSSQPFTSQHDRGKEAGEGTVEESTGGSHGADPATAVLLAVSRTHTAWDSFGTVGERLLRDLADALGLAAGAVWLPGGGSLLARATWGAGPGVRRELERSLRPMRPGRAETLVELAWRCRGPVHAAQAAVRKGGRAAHAPDRLRSQLALPACAGEEVIGVVELHSASPFEPSRRLLEVLDTAGQLLGVALARRRGELKLSPLTVRELQVLTLAAQGFSGREIAADLEISPATVKTHFEHVFRKLGVGDRTAAVARAIRAGLIG